MTDPEAVADRLTLIPGVFEGNPLMPGGYYVTNNDRFFGRAAHVVARNLPDEEDYLPIYLTVGNGGFESMSAVLPADVTFLHIDKDPRVLLTNRVARHAISESNTRQEFGELLESFSRVSYDTGFNAGVWHRAYQYQAERWSVVGRFLPWLSDHFLASEMSFRRARRSLENRTFGYFAMDLFDAEHRRVLADRLSSVGAKVVVANVTNIFDPHYNRDGILPQEVFSDLPMHGEALVMQASGRRHRSRVAQGSPSYAYDGAVVRVDRSVQEIR